MNATSWSENVNFVSAALTIVTIICFNNCFYIKNLFTGTSTANTPDNLSLRKWILKFLAFNTDNGTILESFLGRNIYSAFIVRVSSASAL